jgi:hypothetical protein
MPMAAERVNKNTMIFNILVKEEAEGYVGHCLELDIVSVASDFRQLQNDMRDLIMTQIDYAFAHDNLENLYHPAPPEVWREFFECKEQMEQRHRVHSSFRVEGTDKFIPPWFTTRICKLSPLSA